MPRIWEFTVSMLAFLGIVLIFGIGLVAEDLRNTLPSFNLKVHHLVEWKPQEAF